jgi:hypothetical protein
MSKLNPIYELARSDGYISSNKCLRWALGRDEADIYAVLLSRNAYFEDREELTPDGYFFNTINDIYQATAINEKAQRAAINNLKKSGLIDVERRGIPPTRFFKIIDDLSLLARIIKKGREKARKAFIHHNLPKTPNLSVLKRTKSPGKKKQNTEADIFDINSGQLTGVQPGDMETMSVRLMLGTRKAGLNQ